jgi:hypothetical protein
MVTWDVCVSFFWAQFREQKLHCRWQGLPLDVELVPSSDCR